MDRFPEEYENILYFMTVTLPSLENKALLMFTDEKTISLYHMASEIPVEQHPLQPFLPENGKVLFLGSFPPQKKRWCMDFFYPNFTNDMWRIMGHIFYGDRLHFVDTAAKKYRKDQIVDFLNEKGIGLYDTACAVRRLEDNASDKFLEVVTPTDIPALLEKMPLCHAIVTTGQKATDTICEKYGVKVPSMGCSTQFDMNGRQMTLYRLPSTSRAYPLALEKKAEAYGRMFGELKICLYLQR